MNIELPKDAEGREIPLDTVALYDDSGNVHSIRRFIYTNDFDLDNKWMNSWVVINDNYGASKPEQMHLTPPDSWEKLEKDLNRCIEVDSICGYYSPSGDCCDCALRDIDDDCGCGPVFKSIKQRIRKLRGEGDA